MGTKSIGPRHQRAEEDSEDRESSGCPDACSEQQGVGATAETGMLNKKALRNFEFPSGLDAEARESLEWLRGGNSPPSAIRNELKTIKLELEKKAEAPVSGKQLALFF